MKVGDYVRTENGIITKVKMFYEKKWKEPKLIYARFLCEDYEIYEYPRHVKTSPNIIDLIEVGDYVNGFEVLRIDKECNLYPKTLKCQYPNNVDYFDIFNEDIKSIITKEQFSKMEYKVGEE